MPEFTTDERGFEQYGDPIEADYGHKLWVKESSAADTPHVWLFIDPESAPPGTSPHLSLADAIRLRDALDCYIERVPARWTTGDVWVQKAFEEARKND
jgi:hypothetical protein